LSVIWWRINATTGIRAGLVTIGLATLAMGLEHHLAVWLVLRALAGVASAWVLIYVSAWCLERLASLGRPALSNTVYAGVGAGIGWSWPVFGAAAMASTLATAMLRSAVTNRRLWVASHLVMAFGVALPIVWSGIAPIMLAALFVGGTFMVITMVGMQEARSVG